MKPRLAMVLSALILLAALAAWMTTRSAPGESAQLADGSRLELAAVTFGKEQSFVHGNIWTKLILQATPERLLKKQGPWEKFTHLSLQKLDGRLIKFTPETDSLVLWTVHRAAGQGWYQDNFIRAEVLDENGNECDTARIHHVDSGKNYEVTAWELTAFPRRGKRVGLRIYHQDGQWLKVAEFYVSNPARRSYPTWQPEAMPAPRRDGDLVVALTELAVGDLKPLWHSMLGFGQTRIGLSVTQLDQPSLVWEPVSFLIEDATGNRRDDWRFTTWDIENGEIGHLLPGMFNPDETWKLRIGLARKERAKFLPEELWTVRGAPFSERGLEPFSATTNLQGVNLRLVSTNASFTGNNHPVLEVSFTPPREELRVSFVAATNEHGQAITNIGTAYSPKAGRFFFYEIGTNKTNPHTLDLTVAIHRTRYFSFLAKPSSVATNQSAQRK